VSERRFGHARCPGCGGGLDALAMPAETILADDLPTSAAEQVPPVSVCASCFGVWFEWWAGESASISTTLSALPRSRRAGRRVESACPRDGMGLVSQPYFGSGPTVRRCPRCLGLFAARGQIDELAAFAHTMPDELTTVAYVSLLERVRRLLFLG
jgi:hypothetical protein